MGTAAGRCDSIGVDIGVAAGAAGVAGAGGIASVTAGAAHTRGLPGWRSPHATLRLVLLAFITSVLGMSFVLGTGVAPASAHAILLDSTPESGGVHDDVPATIEFTFNENVRLIDGTIRLFLPADEGEEPEPLVLEAEADGRQVTIYLPEELEDGAYIVGWRVVSADNHPVGGAFSLQIGEGDFEPPFVMTEIAGPEYTQLLVELLTVMQYIGLLLLAGLLFFERFIVRTQGRVEPRTRRLLRVGFWLAASAAVTLIFASGVLITGRELIGELPSGDITILAPDTWIPGLSWQTFVVAGIVTGAGVIALYVGSRSSSALGRWIALSSAAVALIAPLFIGHSMSVRPSWLMMLADYGHLVAAALWCGGLIGLLRYLAAARPNERGGDPRTSPVEAAKIVSQFSRFAFWSVVTLAVSGTTMAVLILPGWRDVYETAWGRTFLLKLVLIAVVMGLAAWNRMKLLPGIAARPSERERWVSLRRILSYEAMVLVAVVAVTGIMTNTSPSDRNGGGGSSVPSATAPFEIESQGLTLNGSVAPGTVGENTLVFTLEYEGEALSSEAAGSVEVAARLPAQDLGPLPATLEFDEATGEYRASLTLPASGEWGIQVSVRIDSFTQPIAIIALTIG